MRFHYSYVLYSHILYQENLKIWCLSVLNRRPVVHIQDVDDEKYAPKPSQNRAENLQNWDALITHMQNLNRALIDFISHRTKKVP